MASINLKLVPFAVPHEVYVASPPELRIDKIMSLPKIKLSALPKEELEQLIEEFAAAVRLIAATPEVPVKTNRSIMQ